MGFAGWARAVAGRRLTPGRIRRIRRLQHRLRTGIGPRAKAAILGCGQIAELHQRAYEASGRAAVAAVHDINARALASALDRWPWVRAYRSVDQMLAEQTPDVVSICTWPTSHADLVRRAAAAGVCGIMCEKPLALSIPEIRGAVDAARAAGVRLAGGHQYRFHPNFVAAAEMLRGGAIGRIIEVEGYVTGALADNGPHLVDAARFLLGDPEVVEVECATDGGLDALYQGIPVETGARGRIIFALDGGETAFGFVSGARSPGILGLTFTGEDGEVEVGRDRLRLNGNDRTLAGEAEFERSHALRFREFLDWASRDRDDYAVPGDVAAAAAEMVVGLYLSASTGEATGWPVPDDADPLGIESLRDAGAARPRPEASAGANASRLALDGGRQAVSDWFDVQPEMGSREAGALKRVITSRCLNRSCGPETSALEAEFARAYGVESAVASTSGTSAIHVAIGALNLEPCSEIITSPITDLGSVIPILLANCVPIFADVDPATGNMTAETIAEKITPRTRAVVLVHLFGRPADVHGVRELLREHQIALIEDCCQAHFAEIDGRKVGTFGDFGCLSLQQSKQITCGDGGITLVNRPELAGRAAAFANKGCEQPGRHAFLGMNYRMTELQAAVTRVQLERLPELLDRRRTMAQRLTVALSAVDGVLPPRMDQGVNPAWWVYNFRIDEERMGVSTDEFAEALMVEGVRLIRPYLQCPVFAQDALALTRTYGESGYPFTEVECPVCSVEDYPGYAEFDHRQMGIFWSPHVRQSHIDQIAAAVKKVARAASSAGGEQRDRGVTP
ncbi:MAG: DegT/DnrJ/EryC1/StrS family aminotransferase [Armatimonadota bacterium]|jgi:perosamine synthetase